MGVDIGIYCTVDKEVILNDPDKFRMDLNWCETLGGDPLVAASECTDEGDYGGHRLWKIPAWIGDLLWIIREVNEANYPHIKRVYIRRDCDGELCEATEESISKLVKLWIKGEYFMSMDRIGEVVYAD